MSVKSPDVKRASAPASTGDRTMNSITIVGNLEKDPVATHFASGSKVVKVSLAENQYRRGEKEEDREPLWHDCELWGDLADRFLKCEVATGKQMVITGMLQKNNYDKKVGGETVKIRRVKVKVQSFQLVGKKAGDSETPDDGGDEANL